MAEANSITWNIRFNENSARRNSAPLAFTILSARQNRRMRHTYTYWHLHCQLAISDTKKRSKITDCTSSTCNTFGKYWKMLYSSSSKRLTLAYRLQCNKKSELMLMRRARAHGSSCSQVILVCFHPFRRNSLFCSHKLPKNHLKLIFLGFKVFQGHRCWHF